MYRWVDHTSEVELWIEATSESEVFTEGSAALAELLAGESANGSDGRVVRVELEAADRPSLLADWLGELVYLSEAEGFVPERVASLELAGGALRAELEGRSASPRCLVKAITYHGLVFEHEDGVWRARVTLDV